MSYYEITYSPWSYSYMTCCFLIFISHLDICLYQNFEHENFWENIGKHQNVGTKLYFFDLRPLKKNDIFIFGFIWKCHIKCSNKHFLKNRVDQSRYLTEMDFDEEDIRQWHCLIASRDVWRKNFFKYSAKIKTGVGVG